ncbi:hypothetical protein A2U01_0059490, partial [Trifolium medium]|nr:hypothetical protein [Trifolium medium]
YLDPIGIEKAKSDIEASEKVSTKTLTQEGYEPPKVTDDPIHTVGVKTPKFDNPSDAGKIVNQVLQSLNEQVPESDAGKNAGTSGTQEDMVEDSVPTTPVDNIVSDDPQENNDIAAEGNTHPDESE